MINEQTKHSSMGGHYRGHKALKAVAARGWKLGKMVAKRGHKFLKDTVKSVGMQTLLQEKLQTPSQLWGLCSAGWQFDRTCRIAEGG